MGSRQPHNRTPPWIGRPYRRCSHACGCRPRCRDRSCSNDSVFRRKAGTGIHRSSRDPPSVDHQRQLHASNYGPCTNVQTNQTIIRPIIPRVPPDTLLPFTQLIRPTFALVTVPSRRGGSRTEVGDLQLFDLAVLPWLDRRKTGSLDGSRTDLCVSHGDVESAGQGSWQAGPAFGAVYTGIPGLLVGFIAQNPISSLTRHHTAHLKTPSIQPVFALPSVG